MQGVRIRVLYWGMRRTLISEMLLAGSWMWWKKDDGIVRGGGGS